MGSAQPDVDTLEAALAMAVRAPSVHNTQPWRWRITDRAIHLYADPARHLVATDPHQRGLVLSCGAALHHLRVALAVLGWSATVEHLPNPADPDHLAAVEFAPHEPTPTDFELSAALMHRQSDRRRFSPWQVPSGYIRTIATRAAHCGAVVRHVPDTLRARLARPARAAVDQHAEDAEYQIELAAWSGRHGTSDGVPAVNSPRPRHQDEIPVRTFTDPELVDRTEHPDGAEWMVVCTAADDRLSRLRAGEALSALLLTATHLGLSSCLQTEPLGLPELRADIRSQLLHDCAYPQAMVRIGWVPTNAAPLPHTPRRPIEEIIDR
ncbi:Acg family FMN-binding oxidoreductase [Nocardia iowensis]|uniref:NAD(P)H nitroreductase n=1 Tax=Nocardia iowensis TaxID=204891 RepID=A0ABX8RM14_NOCIO|nr:NAD(P)H nitroreductase [Nocardia iowensis]QXN89957.1 NAD(P)H nitroreductase [Nocardia iowensis]